MPLFKKNGSKLTLLNAIQPDKEKDLQRLIENNLQCVLDMHLLASEYRTASGRIDSIAVDSEGAPVIIEYKRNKNDNVINQSLSYLKWLTAQQPEFFEMLMQKQLSKDIFDNMRLDWKHPRVVCIAESFSQFDIDTVEVVPLRIELFKYRLHEGDLFSLESVSFNEMQKNLADAVHLVPVETVQSITMSMKEQSNASHLIRTLYDELRERIMSLDQYIIEKAGKRCISYRLTKNFAEVLIRRDRLVIELRPINYQDPLGMVERIAESYTVTMNRRVTLTSASDLDYVFGLVEQSYKNVL